MVVGISTDIDNFGHGFGRLMLFYRYYLHFIDNEKIFAYI